MKEFPKMVYTNDPKAGDFAVNNPKHPGAFYRIVNEATEGYRDSLEAPVLDVKPVSDPTPQGEAHKAKKTAKKAAKKVA